MTEYYAAYLQQQMISEVAYIAFLVVFVIVVAAALLALAMYVLESVGLYTIARNRGLRHPWMAWVPVLNHWLLGCVSDQYRYVVKGQIRNRRTLLLALVILSTLVGWFGSGVSVANASALGQMLEGGAAPYAGMITGTVGTGLLVAAIGLAVRLLLKVFRYLTLYDVYTSCDPNNNVLYLVLGILFSFLTPVFLFVNRNKDGGMPPRKEAAYQPTAEEFTEV